MSGTEPGDAVRVSFDRVCGSSHQVVNAILTQLDRLKAFPNVLVLATSNLAGGIGQFIGMRQANRRRRVHRPRRHQAIYRPPTPRGGLLDPSDDAQRARERQAARGAARPARRPHSTMERGIWGRAHAERLAHRRAREVSVSRATQDRNPVPRAQAQRPLPPSPADPRTHDAGGQAVSPAGRVDGRDVPRGRGRGEDQRPHRAGRGQARPPRVDEHVEHLHRVTSYCIVQKE